MQTSSTRCQFQFYFSTTTLLNFTDAAFYCPHLKTTIRAENKILVNVFTCFPRESELRGERLVAEIFFPAVSKRHTLGPWIFRYLGTIYISDEWDVWEEHKTCGILVLMSYWPQWSPTFQPLDTWGSPKVSQQSSLSTNTKVQDLIRQEEKRSSPSTNTTF